MEKIFAGRSNNVKIVNVFSLESFPLYSNTHSPKHLHTLTNRIVAGDEPHYDLQVRLVNTATNNSFSYEGRVEVLHHRGLWGTICNEQWIINDAHAICRYVRP